MSSIIDLCIFKNIRFVCVLLIGSLIFSFHLSGQSTFLVDEIINSVQPTIEECSKFGIKSMKVKTGDDYKVKWYFNQDGEILSEQKGYFIYEYKFGKRISARNISLGNVSLAGRYKKYRYTPGLVTIAYIDDQNQTFKKQEYKYADLDNTKLESEKIFFDDSLSVEYVYKYDTYSRVALKEKYQAKGKSVYWKYSYPKSNTKLEEKFTFYPPQDTFTINSSLLNSSTFSADSSTIEIKEIDYKPNGEISNQLKYLVVKNKKGAVIKVVQSKDNEITQGISTLNDQGDIDFVSWTDGSFKYKQLFHYADNSLLIGITYEDKSGKLIFADNQVVIEYKYYEK